MLLQWRDDPFGRQAMSLAGSDLDFSFWSSGIPRQR